MCAGSSGFIFTLNVKVLFIEAVCESADLIDANIRDLKLSSPDYAGIPSDEAILDLRVSWSLRAEVESVAAY